MAEGFKIAEGYIEIETRIDSADVAKDVNRAVDQAESRVRSRAGKQIGEALVQGAGERLRDSRGRFVSSVQDPVKESKPDFEETGRRHIGSRLMGGIKDALTKGKELGQGLAKSLLSSSKMPLVVAAIGAVGTLLGGGVASALTVALGIGTAGAFLGLGALALKENKKIQKAFTRTGKSIQKALAQAAKPLVGPFIQALKDVQSTVQYLKPYLTDIFAAVSQQVGPLTKGLRGLLTEALIGIHDAMPGVNAAFGAFSQRLPSLGKALGDFFRDVFRYPDLISRLSAGMVDFAAGGIRFLGKAVQGLTVIWGAFTNGVELWKMGWSTVAGMIDGGTGMFSRLGAALGPVKKAIGEAWKALVQFANETDRSKLPTSFRNLVAKVKAVWDPLKRFLGVVWDEAWALVKRIWNTKVKPWINDTALPWLKTKVQQGMAAVFKAMVDKAVGFLRSLPGRARSAISSLPGAVGGILSSAAATARSRASSLVSGFVDRVKALPGRARTALNRAKSAVTGAFSGAGGWLTSAGRRIIDGLISGIQGALGRLRDLLNRVTNMIPDWKGPADVDRRLLEPAGKSIMEGLRRGIESQVPDLRDQLQGITGAVPRMAAAPQQAPGRSVHVGGITVQVTVPAGSDGRKIGREAAREIYLALKELERSYA